MTKEESSLLKKLITGELLHVDYDSENNISLKPSGDINDYSSKFSYCPWPKPEDEEAIKKMKQRGLGEYIRDPFYIQEQLKAAKRNDRFKNLPAVAIGVDESGDTYFYKKGVGNQFRNITLSGVVRIPSKAPIETELDNYYHVYSPFEVISKRGIYDKNYSLKVLGWLVENADSSESLREVFKFMIKGMLITHDISPDLIVTMRSSKPINSAILKLFKSDEYFSKTRFVEISKPSTRSVLKEYIDGDYEDSDAFNNTSVDDELKMKEMGPADRKLYATICQNIFHRELDMDNIKGKNIIFYDDLITTGNTLSRILIPLYEKSNKIIPFSFLIR